MINSSNAVNNLTTLSQIIVTKFYKYSLSTLVLQFLLALPVSAVELLTDRIDLNCSESNSYIIACSYRQLEDIPIRDIAAWLQGQEYEITNHSTYPDNDSVTAILFVVDTSDPGRQNVIEKNASQITRLTETLEPYHIAGLANFDKDLVVKAPIGSNTNTIVTAAASLEASGLTTELYRNTIKAIEVLGRVNADRKVLFLFSDGQAEDKAYFHEDVINVARRQGVIINALGFARSTPLSVSLQTLRRLSEESGGKYIEAGSNHALPETFLAEPLENVDRGGKFIVNLEPNTDVTIYEPELTLCFSTSTQAITVSFPVDIPEPDLELTPAQPVVSPQVINTPQPGVAAPAGEPEYVDFLLWYGVPGALFILILLTLFTLYIVFKKEKQMKPGNVTYAEVKPLAYLIGQDEKRQEYPMTTSTWRIGRSQDNEMTMQDSSISRRHAEINRESNGQFIIYDRGSTNGVYVNNKKINKHILSEGDIIEIGDIFLRFTEHPKDFQLGEDTAMLKTRAPV